MSDLLPCQHHCVGGVCYEEDETDMTTGEWPCPIHGKPAATDGGE